MGEGAGGDGTGDDDALAVLGHFGGLEQLLQGVVGAGVGGWLVDGARKSNDRGQISGLAGGFVLAGGDFLNFEAQRSECTGNGERGRDAGDDRGVFFERKGEAKDVNGATLGEGQADLADAPNQGEQGHVVVVALEERGAGKGQRGSAMAVEHGMDLLSGWGVGDGNGVIADLRDADRAVLGGDVVDAVADVGFAGGCVGVEPRVEARAGDSADEDHGVGDRAVGPVGIGHAVQSDGYLVEVALGVDADVVNELLVFRDAVGRLEVIVSEGADGLEVDVNDAVRLGKQARGLGRGLGAQENGEGQQKQDCGDDKKRFTGASRHGDLMQEPSGMSVTECSGVSGDSGGGGVGRVKKTVSLFSCYPRSQKRDLGHPAFAWGKKYSAHPSRKKLREGRAASVESLAGFFESSGKVARFASRGFDRPHPGRVSGHRHPDGVRTGPELDESGRVADIVAIDRDLSTGGVRR